MLVLDTPAQIRWEQATAQQQTRERLQKALEHEIFSNTISVRDDAGFDTSSLLVQMGRPLHSVEVQRRLHLCNSKLIFERAIRHPELTGIYIEKNERTQAGTWVKRKIHVCGMGSDILPEFSVRHETVKRVPNPEVVLGGGAQVPREAVKWQEIPTFYAETRGWRTVLIRLLHLGLITRGDAEQHFDWTPSRDSELWAVETR